MTVKEMLLKQLEQEKYSRDEAHRDWSTVNPWHTDNIESLYYEYLERKGRVAGFERVLALLVQYGVI